MNYNPTPQRKSAQNSFPRPPIFQAPSRVDQIWCQIKTQVLWPFPCGLLPTRGFIRGSWCVRCMRTKPRVGSTDSKSPSSTKTRFLKSGCFAGRRADGLGWQAGRWRWAAGNALRAGAREVQSAGARSTRVMCRCDGHISR